MKEISAEVRDALTLLTPDQVCELLQMKSDWVYDQCAAGKLPHLRLGRSIRFRPLELQAYLAGTWKP
jgi:excisionase family DNA binding protein